MRSSLRRPALGDAAISIGALALLLIVLVSMDQRVRGLLALDSGRPSAEVVAAGWRARQVAFTILEVVRDQSLDHAPLMIFVLAATVLTLFMLRT
jgi:hypothetical protein